VSSDLSRDASSPSMLLSSSSSSSSSSVSSTTGEGGHSTMECSMIATHRATEVSVYSGWKEGDMKERQLGLVT